MHNRTFSSPSALIPIQVLSSYTQTVAAGWTKQQDHDFSSVVLLHNSLLECRHFCSANRSPKCCSFGHSKFL